MTDLHEAFLLAILIACAFTLGSLTMALWHLCILPGIPAYAYCNPQLQSQPQPDTGAAYMSPAERIIQAVHDAHAYVPRNASNPSQPFYVCHNYSIDAYIALNSSGFDAYYVWGNNANSSASDHAWVRVCQTVPIPADSGIKSTYCTDYDVTAGAKARPYYPDYVEILPCTVNPATRTATCMDGLMIIK